MELSQETMVFGKCQKLTSTVKLRLESDGRLQILYSITGKSSYKAGSSRFIKKVNRKFVLVGGAVHAYPIIESATALY